jgi:hypothetical protein
MPNPRVILTAATPLLLLIVLTLLFRFLPEALGDSTPDAAAATLPPRPLRVRPELKYTPVTDADQKAITKLVDGQLNAICRRDFAAALEFSSPAFRAGWTPKRFGAMVADGYTNMLSATDWTFERAETSGLEARIKVHVTSANGRQATHLYLLGQEEGRWHVNGCTPDIAALSRPRASASVVPVARAEAAAP